MEYFTYVLFRFAHTLVGIVWIGLLYYFNFVQTEYLKEAEPDAKSDVIKKLEPNEAGNIDFYVSLVKTKNKNKNDLIFFVLLFTYILFIKIYIKYNEKK